MSRAVGGADQGADQEALEIVAEGLLADHLEDCSSACQLDALSFQATAQAILSALAEAGYTVVKTHWEYGTSELDGSDVYASRTLEGAKLLISEGYRPLKLVRHRAWFGPWVPVPEGDDSDGTQ